MARNARELREDIRVFHKHKEEMAWQEELVFRGRRIVIPVEMKANHRKSSHGSQRNRSIAKVGSGKRLLAGNATTD